MINQPTGTGQLRSGTASRRVLLVDDEAPLRKNLVRAFEREAFEVATAGSLKEAYEVIDAIDSRGEAAPCDVVRIDMVKCWVSQHRSDRSVRFTRRN